MSEEYLLHILKIIQNGIKQTSELNLLELYSDYRICDYSVDCVQKAMPIIYSIVTLDKICPNQIYVIGSCLLALLPDPSFFIEQILQIINETTPKTVIFNVLNYVYKIVCRISAKLSPDIIQKIYLFAISIPNYPDFSLKIISHIFCLIPHTNPDIQKTVEVFREFLSSNPLESIDSISGISDQELSSIFHLMPILLTSSFQALPTLSNLSKISTILDFVVRTSGMNPTFWINNLDMARLFINVLFTFIKTLDQEEPLVYDSENYTCSAKSRNTLGIFLKHLMSPPLIQVIGQLSETVLTGTPDHDSLFTFLSLIAELDSTFLKNLEISNYAQQFFGFIGAEDDRIRSVGYEALIACTKVPGFATKELIQSVMAIPTNEKKLELLVLSMQLLSSFLLNISSFDFKTFITVKYLTSLFQMSVQINPNYFNKVFHEITKIACRFIKLEDPLCYVVKSESIIFISSQYVSLFEAATDNEVKKGISESFSLVLNQICDKSFISQFQDTIRSMLQILIEALLEDCEVGQVITPSQTAYIQTLAVNSQYGVDEEIPYKQDLCHAYIKFFSSNNPPYIKNDRDLTVLGYSAFPSLNGKVYIPKCQVDTMEVMINLLSTLSNNNILDFKYSQFFLSAVFDASKIIPHLFKICHPLVSLFIQARHPLLNECLIEISQAMVKLVDIAPLDAVSFLDIQDAFIYPDYPFNEINEAVFQSVEKMYNKSGVFPVETLSKALNVCSCFLDYSYRKFPVPAAIQRLMPIFQQHLNDHSLLPSTIQFVMPFFQADQSLGNVILSVSETMLSDPLTIEKWAKIVISSHSLQEYHQPLMAPLFQQFSKALEATNSPLLFLALTMILESATPDMAMMTAWFNYFSAAATIKEMKNIFVMEALSDFVTQVDFRQIGLDKYPKIAEVICRLMESGNRSKWSIYNNFRNFLKKQYYNHAFMKFIRARVGVSRISLFSQFFDLE